MLCIKPYKSLILSEFQTDSAFKRQTLFQTILCMCNKFECGLVALFAECSVSCYLFGKELLIVMSHVILLFVKICCPPFPLMFGISFGF